MGGDDSAHLGRDSIAAYHASRETRHQPFSSGCYAPFVGLSFDMNGWVSVCAPTRTTPLGRVGDSPLRSMWEGETAERLRAALLADDFRFACTDCGEGIASGNYHGVFARSFDRFGVDPAGWPQRLEFALTNTCNLQCAMCSGEFSSAIRAQREGLPPLISPYGPAFLDEIDPFLAHARQARFLGGEPFLSEINHRIWDRIARHGGTTECNVTTNGTVWNRHVDELLDAVPFSVGISIDGATAATVEAIRVGASHDVLMHNVDRFLAARERYGTSVSFTYCLMTANWHEFWDFLRFADDSGCDVYMNTVLHPAALSLYRLDRASLHDVVRRMEAEWRPEQLDRNRTVWTEAVQRLRHHLERPGDAGDGGDQWSQWQPLAESVWAFRDDVGLLTDAMRRSAEGGRVSTIACDPGQRVVSGDEYLGIRGPNLIGRHTSELSVHLTRTLGHRARLLAERSGGGTVVRVVAYSDRNRAPTVVLMVTRNAGSAATERLAAILGPPGSTVSTGMTPVETPLRRRTRP
jgi:MoaA/NifB/PqqE/SkfB family radical SAM enzyme